MPEDLWARKVERERRARKAAELILEQKSAELYDACQSLEARSVDLEASEKRYRAIFETSPLPICLWDVVSFEFVAVNSAALQTYGYSTEEFLRMRVTDIYAPDDLAEFQAHLECLPDSLSPLRHSRHRRKDGATLDVEVRSHPIEWAGRKVRIAVCVDVTERMLAEGRRDAMELQLIHGQKLESVGQLAAGIAHEINTPTQYVGDNLHFLADAFADLHGVLRMQEQLLRLLEDPLSPPEAVARARTGVDAADTGFLLEEIPQAIEQAIDGVTRVSTLVKAMKEFSHPGAKEKVPADLNNAIQSTITVARNEWKYVAEMETFLDAELPLVPCLVSEVNQVVLNLIVNAAHAIGEAQRNSAPGKGALGKITIRTRACPPWAEIRVEDSGCGIPPAARGRVFDPFFTTKEVGKGTGQGLAIARSTVVDKHGGSIAFETETGRGTTFVVRLPLA